ncbi:hypothetical protein AB4084_12265, partial [Lysobacter sp. 2RAB21]
MLPLPWLRSASIPRVGGACVLAVAALVCGCTRTAALAAKPALEPAHIPVSIPQPPSLPSHGILFRIEPAQAVADTAAPETQSRPPRASSYLFGTI